MDGGLHGCMYVAGGDGLSDQPCSRSVLTAECTEQMSHCRTMSHGGCSWSRIEMMSASGKYAAY